MEMDLTMIAYKYTGIHGRIFISVCLMPDKILKKFLVEVKIARKKQK